MVLAYHLIWVAYGWWLPNDPRGSMSDTIKRDMLAELGELHQGRKRVQPAGREIREFYEKAKDLLLHDLLAFTESEVAMIAHAFAETIKAQRYTCYACAIMHDHVHLVIRKHRQLAEDMITHFQRASKDAVMLLNKRHPLHLFGVDRGGKCSWTLLRILSGRSGTLKTIRPRQSSLGKAMNS
jgi:hypothetical protein